MRMTRLPPSWTYSTETLEEAPDAPDEHLRSEHPGGLRAKRLRGGFSHLACLKELRRLGIPFQRAPARRGVWLPVRITGPLHGVTYKALYSKKPPLVDCQFALALEKAARVLARFGVTRALYTSTWRPPPRRRGRRIGHHPQGLAMDINELRLKDGTHLSILKHWEKRYGGPGNCVGRTRTRKGRLLRRMTCALERAHIFRRILSPDSDRPHKNHWHLSGAEIGEAFVRRRWCGRTLEQPLPGDRGFRRYYRWYSCWKIRNPRRRYRCYRYRARRKPRPPVRYKRPRQKPKVAIWLRSQLAPDDSEPDPGSRSVALSGGGETRDGKGEPTRGNSEEGGPTRGKNETRRRNGEATTGEGGR